MIANLNKYGPEFNMDGTRKVFSDAEMAELDSVVSQWKDADWQRMLDQFSGDPNMVGSTLGQIKSYLIGPLRNGEHFTYSIDTGVLMFDVVGARQIIKLTGSSSGRQLYQVPVTEYYDTFIMSGKVEISSPRLPLSLIDPSIPSIVADLGDHYGAFLIDGYHRLAKARVQGRRFLPAYLLSERETSAILYSPQSVTPEWDRSVFGLNPLTTWEEVYRGISP